MKFDEEKFYHYIGNRLRELRKLRGMSQAKLGKELGVTFQQVQKYESGANRMSIDKAIMVPAVLGISISELLGE
jgi:transcriptional regulator with XRE-family HTH domain